MANITRYIENSTISKASITISYTSYHAMPAQHEVAYWCQYLLYAVPAIKKVGKTALGRVLGQ